MKTVGKRQWGLLWRVDCKVCGIAIALWLSVIKSGCNERANKIQSSKLEPVIIVTCTLRTRNNIMNTGSAWLIVGFWIGWIGFIDTLYIQLRTTSNYNATTNLHTLQFTVTHALGPQSSPDISWQRISFHFNSHMGPSLHSLIPFFPLICNLPTLKTWLNCIPLLPSSYPTGWHLEIQPTIFFVLFITPRHRSCRKQSLSIFEKVCLQHCCTATEVIRLLLVYSWPQECVYQAVA
jgi:hypothetical protein